MFSARAQFHSTICSSVPIESLPRYLHCDEPALAYLPAAACSRRAVLRDRSRGNALRPSGEQAAVPRPRFADAQSNEQRAPVHGEFPATAACASLIDSKRFFRGKRRHNFPAPRSAVIPSFMHFPVPPSSLPSASESTGLVRALTREDVQWNRPVFKAPPLDLFFEPLDATIFAQELPRAGLSEH